MLRGLIGLVICLVLGWSALASAEPGHGCASGVQDTHTVIATCAACSDTAPDAGDPCGSPSGGACTHCVGGCISAGALLAHSVVVVHGGTALRSPRPSSDRFRRRFVNDAWRPPIPS